MPTVGIPNMSMAATFGAWLCRKVRHTWLGGPRRLTMYLATVDGRGTGFSFPKTTSAPDARGFLVSANERVGEM